MKDISLQIAKRKREDRGFLAKLFYMRPDLPLISRPPAFTPNCFYFVLAVEGMDATSMGSAYRNPLVTVNGEQLAGKTFVMTNNNETLFFPFEKRAFRGLLFVEVNLEKHKYLHNQGALSVILTFEDVEGNLKDSQPVEVQNNHSQDLGNLFDNLMPW